MLLQIEHFQTATAEVDKAEEVLSYMLRPSIEECLGLRFGKVEATDREIRTRRRRRRARRRAETTTIGR